MHSEIYNQVTQNMGLVDLSDRCWVEVKGGDSKKFLNGILTNNIQTLQPKTGCYSCLCTPKGKMIADLFCYNCPPLQPGGRSENYFGIDCSSKLKLTLLETLKKYIIFQKVELFDQTDKWGTCAVIGPKVNGEKGLGDTQCWPWGFVRGPHGNTEGQDPTLSLRANYDYDFVEWEGFKIWMIRKTMWGLPAFEMWVARDQLPSLKSKLNVPELDPETQEVLRIESATPLFGVDMDENTIPQEANLYTALSFNKGCYVGQEVIARLEHRGHVGKQLRSLKLEGDKIPQRGEKIFSEDGQEIGTVTSSCFSPKFSSPIALGYIRYASLSLKEVRIGNSTANFL